MSHFTRIATKFVSAAALVQALADIGLTEVETHETAQRLYGYQGDLRRDDAEIIVRRRFLRPASNDLGFKRQPDGTFSAVVSEYDVHIGYNRAWLDRLRQRYAYHAVREQLAEQEFNLVEETVDEQQRIHLVLRRMA